MTSRSRTVWEVAVRASIKYSACRAFASSSSKKASAEASTGCSTICSTGTSSLLKRRRPLPREWRLQSPWRVVHLALHSLLGPGLRAVVRRCSQGHTERQLLMTPVHPQPSLPPSLRSANGGLRARVHHHKRSHSNGNADLRKDACWCRWCHCCPHWS